MTSILQVLVNVLDHDMSPVEAVSAPRVDFQGDVVQAEYRIPRVVCEGLERLGYRVNRRTLNYDTYFARPQLIVGEQDGDQRHRLRQRDHREEPDVHVRRTPPRADLRPAARLVRLQRPSLPAERLNDAHAREPLLQRRQRLCHAVADRQVDAACTAVEGPAREGQHRQGDERDGGQGRRQDHEHSDGEHDLKAASDDLDERLARRVEDEAIRAGKEPPQNSVVILLDDRVAALPVTSLRVRKNASLRAISDRRPIVARTATPDLRVRG